MCELLGMSANVPTDICFSFQAFYIAVVAQALIAMGGASPFMKRAAIANLETLTLLWIHRLRV